MDFLGTFGCKAFSDDVLRAKMANHGRPGMQSELHSGALACLKLLRSNTITVNCQLSTVNCQNARMIPPTLA